MPTDQLPALSAYAVWPDLECELIDAECQGVSVLEAGGSLVYATDENDAVSTYLRLHAPPTIASRAALAQTKLQSTLTANRRVRESAIENFLVKEVKALGGEVRKVQWIGRRGAPDRLVMLPSRGRHTQIINGFEMPFHAPAKSIWVELKATGVKPEAHQLREHERMRALGQHVVVIDSFVGVRELLR